MKYERILLKLSGEALSGEQDFGISNNKILEYAQEIKSIVDKKVEVALIGSCTTILTLYFAAVSRTFLKCSTIY